ncbi:hypothetical protein DPMN_056442 [Dreissena polymorpha]|uniref:Uncharacterized protein n=1 Tax=Dreissena polymorpha TaxID=45954 RepID=A0A9D4CTG0_DREPO|nr:hypothetical protein DPMN_056442 [Dreissena polymorpha]
MKYSGLFRLLLPFCVITGLGPFPAVPGGNIRDRRALAPFTGDLSATKNYIAVRPRPREPCLAQQYRSTMHR